MTFAELNDELFARGTDYLDEDTAGRTRASRWVQQAYKEILNIHVWPFLRTTATGSAGTGSITIADLRRVRFVRDTITGLQLQRTALADIVADGNDPDDTGTPWGWYQDTDTVIKAYPLGGTLKVYYFKRGADLTDTDEPIFDEQYHNLIVDRAMINAYTDSDNFDAAAALTEKFNASIAEMANDYMVYAREPRYVDVYPYDG